MYSIPESVKARLLLAHLTPARLTQLFDTLALAINDQNMDDACVELDYTHEGEVFGDMDLLPTITIGLRKAVPPPHLILPKLETP
jgi:hypothetical protein